MQQSIKKLTGLPILFICSLSFGQVDSAKKLTLSEVVVTGQYKPQSLRNSVYQLRVIGNEKIRLSGATTVQQVLNSQLGFRFSNDNTLGTSDVELMGMSGRNVKILLDGVPMVDRGDTRESLNQVDVNTIERIEIVEGPMSVSYGSDALAGVINIITKKTSKQKLTVNAKVQEETAGTEYYPFSYKGSHQQNIGINWHKNGWNLAGGGSHNDFAGWGGDEFGRQKTWKPKEQWLGNIKAGFSNDKFNVYYRIDGLNEMITSRGKMGLTYKAIDQEYITNRFTHQVQGQYRFNEKLQLSGLAAYTDYERMTKTTEHDFTKGTDVLTTGAGEQDTSKFNSFTFRTTLQYKLSDMISLQPGVDINREAASGARISGSPVITDYAFFISSEIKATDKINIRPGLRFIKNSVYDAPPVIPSLNTKLVLNKTLDLRLAYAYGFRSPALRELYFDFRDANHNIVGNTNLKAEHSNSFTGSLNWSPVMAGKVQYQATLGGFYNHFSNLIDYAMDPNNSAQYTTVNINTFKTTGATLENKFTWKNLNASAGFSYIGRYNSFSTDALYKYENLPEFVWTPEFNTNLLYTIKKPALSVGLFYKYAGTRPGYELVYNSAIGKDEVHLTKIAAANWADLTITKPFFKYLVATAGIRNIFDVTDIRSTSTNSGGTHSTGALIPAGYGRSYFLGLAIQWAGK